jgi:hypothetical protein
MAETKKTSDTKRIIDVTHADKAAPSGNSKSVIVSNRPLLQDPMVVAEEEKPAKSTAKLKLEPPAVEDKPEATPEAPAEKPPAPPEEKTQQLQAENDTQVKQQTHIDELAESKKYYLPIDTIENRRSRRFVGLGILLSLVLIVAWADIALDAGIIKLNGIKPATHFFSN